MGGYNQTCGVSHLPIEDGAPVTAFLLTRPIRPSSGDFDGWTGTSPTWQVVSLPFHGTYDDEGSINLDATGNEVAENLATLITGRSMAASLDMAREGEDPSEGANSGMELRLMMIHRGLYERLSSSVGDATYAVEAPRIGEYLDTMRASWATVSRKTHGTEPSIPYGNLGEIEDWCEHTGRNWTEAPYAAKVFGRDCGISHKLRMGIVALLSRAAKAGDREGELALVEPALRLRMLDDNFLRLRRSWQPQAGLGASDEDYALHREVAAWAAERCLEADPDCETSAPRP